MVFELGFVPGYNLRESLWEWVILPPPGEFRLCCYLKLNVSSKEIAEFLGISIRGGESLRYRLRKS